MRPADRQPAILALAALLVAATVATAGAGPRPGNVPGRALRVARTFSVSATYTGQIAGVMWADGVRYRLAPNATVYVAGAGPVEQGHFVSGASVYLSGERHGDALLVRSVLVREDGAGGRAARGRSQDVGVASSSAPR
jgi:hypothetical protein